MKFATFRDVASRWWKGEWRQETEFNDRMLSDIRHNGGLLSGEIALRIARKYRVVRQFPKFDTVSKMKHASEFDPVAQTINYAVPVLNTANLADQVSAIAAELAALRIVGLGKRAQAVTGGKGRYFTNKGCVPVSAVSKWTWFACPEIGVIYDKEARMTLRAIGFEVPDRDYPAFVNAFEQLYRNKRGDLDTAVASLGAAKPSEPWAGRKLLDLWLWYNSPTNPVRGRSRCT